MTDNATTPAPDVEPIRLAEIAMEMETTIDVVERELGAAHIFMHSGFRSTTPFRARALLEEHHRQKAEAARLAARNQERLEKFCEAQRAAIPKGIVQYGLTTTTIDPGPADVPPVVRMTAGAAADYEGSVMTKRPGRLDWMLGRGEGGGTFGPSAEAIRRRAEKKGKDKT